MPREAFAYEHTDIPPGTTLAEWRGMRASQSREARGAPSGALRMLWGFLIRRPRAAAG
jgi:hypothetical protein